MCSGSDFRRKGRKERRDGRLEGEPVIQGIRIGTRTKVFTAKKFKEVLLLPKSAYSERKKGRKAAERNTRLE